MSKDKIEGFLFGLGAGVLFAAFIELREKPAAAAAGEQEDTAQLDATHGPVGPPHIPVQAVSA